MKQFKLEELNAYEIGNLVNEKKIKPSEVVSFFINRIKERNESTNAFVYTNFEYAMDVAYKQDKLIEEGKYLGPFAGVPFALKDFLPSKKGWYHTFGGVKTLTRVDEYDSAFNVAMEDAGGIAIGKTNAPTFGFRGTTDNLLFGPTKNPFNLNYNAGGSSGGSAAAVADGLVPIAEGGDAGGSIRIPASWCNLVGFKPSVGTVPSIARPDAWSATHPYCFNGGLTKSVIDSAILLSYMQKYDPKDPLSIDLGNIDYLKEIKKPLKDLRICFTYNFDLFEVEDDVKNNIFIYINRLRELGYNIEEYNFNFKRDINEYAEIWCRSISVDTAIEFRDFEKEKIDIKELEKELPKEFIHYNNLASQGNIFDYYQFNLARTEIYDEINDALEKYDLIISPTTCIKPVLNSNDFNTLGPDKINGKNINKIIGFAQTFLTNFTGHPSISIPSGLTNDNLPLGIHIIGKKYDNLTLLKFAYKLENKLPWKDNYKIALNRK